MHSAIGFSISIVGFLLDNSCLIISGALIGCSGIFHLINSYKVINKEVMNMVFGDANLN